MKRANARHSKQKKTTKETSALFHFPAALKSIQPKLGPEVWKGTSTMTPRMPKLTAAAFCIMIKSPVKIFRAYCRNRRAVFTEN